MADSKDKENCERSETVYPSPVTYGSVPDLDGEKTELSEPKKFKFSSNQKWGLIILCFGNFCAGSCASLQAPFFPAEAEEKGATASQYGLIFGVYHMTMCFLAPLIGNLVIHISPKFVINTGFVVLGTTSILFAILDLVSETKHFVALAFIIRTSEGVGASCVRIACATFAISQFSENLASAYAFLDMSTGVGAITGPVFGGALYDLGGYELPFFCVACFLFLDAAFIFKVLPESENKMKGTKKIVNIFKVWTVPRIILFSCCIFSSAAFVGFLAAGLEPHIRKLGLSKVVIGFIFAILGSIFALSAPVWGWLNDRKLKSTFICLIGSILLALGTAFMGPLPFIPSETNVIYVCISIAIVGISYGAKSVSCFTGALQAAKNSGLPDDMTTYGTIASINAISKSLGSAFGPSVGGIMIDKMDFRYASLIFFCLESVLVIVLIIAVLSERSRGEIFRHSIRDKYQEIKTEKVQCSSNQSISRENEKSNEVLKDHEINTSSWLEM